GGADLDAAWQMIGPQLAADHDAWVGVTGRTYSSGLLQEFDPVRYAALDVPTNDIEWDILRQGGGLVRAGSAQSTVRGETPDRVYAAGYSQSGLATAPFAGTSADQTRMEDDSPVYDGYPPAARSASLTPPHSGPAFAPTFVFLPIGPADAPVIDVEPQSEVE